MPPLNENLVMLQCHNNYLTSLSSLNSNLKTFMCDDNYLTSLPPLNTHLEYFSCNKNKLTSLPPINPNLRLLCCSDNCLTRLPELNSKLITLKCYSNKLTCLPFLPPEIVELCVTCNPIEDLMMDIVKNHINKKKMFTKQIVNIVNILFQFKYLYYSLKYKSRFRHWLWIKVREPKIREYYSPVNLEKILSGIDNDDYERFDNILNNW